MISNLEKGFCNIIKLVTNLCPFLCWKHIHHIIKDWVWNHNGTSDDILVHVNNVMNLLQWEPMDVLKAVPSHKWSKGFVQNFQA